MPFDPLANKYVRFVRSVFEVTTDAEYKIRRLGSGIVVACDGAFFLITARHILTNQGADPTEIVISYPDSGTTLWPTTACVHLQPVDSLADDNTFSDFALYQLHTTRDINSIISEYDYLPFPAEVTFPYKKQLFAFGFRDAECDFDLDKRQHLLTEVAVEGWYAGATDYLGIHAFESPHLSTSQNGMSGGPITYLDTSRIGRHLLAGMIVQAGGQKLHFIDACMLRKALLYAVPRLRNLSDSMSGLRGNQQ